VEQHGVQRYQQTLLDLEEQERISAETQRALRRLVSRLAVFGSGRHKAADVLLERIGQEMRREPTMDTLDGLLSDMVDAIARLDEATAASPPSASGHRALAVALDGIELDPALGSSAEVLKVSLQDTATDVLSKARELAHLVNRHGRLLKDDIEIMQGVLHSVGSRLEDIRRYIDVEVTEQESNSSEGHAWDALMREEMRELGERSRQAMDVVSLRAQVTARLETIGQHFRSYRASEEVRFASYLQRADQMRQRVEELETQTATLKDSLKREHERASTDQLTGIPNRFAYETHIEAAWRQCTLEGSPLCVAALDIDHFKRINDSLGHAAGDAVLRIVGQTLHGQADDRLFVCRYGGEEFVLVFARTGLDEALRRGDALRILVEQLAFRANGKAVPVTLSGGLAFFRPEDTPEEAMQRADRALYAAKDAGRNRLMS
jgi:diguanylate cyclase